MRHSPFLPRFVKFGVLDMMCYKVPKFIEIEGEMSVFELGNERLKIHSLSAIFLQKNGGTKPQGFTSLCRQAQLHSKNKVFSSHLHRTPEALLVKSFHSANAPFHL